MCGLVTYGALRVNNCEMLLLKKLMMERPHKPQSQTQKREGKKMKIVQMGEVIGIPSRCTNDTLPDTHRENASGVQVA